MRGLETSSSALSYLTKRSAYVTIPYQPTLNYDDILFGEHHPPPKFEI